MFKLNQRFTHQQGQRGKSDERTCLPECNPLIHTNPTYPHLGKVSNYVISDGAGSLVIYPRDETEQVVKTAGFIPQ